MSKRLLVIDRDDLAQFFLSVKGGTLTLGADAGHAELVLRDLSIARIRCEIEVEAEQVVVSEPEAAAGPGGGPILRKVIRPGENFRHDRSRLRLETGAAGPAPAVAPAQADGGPVFDDSLGFAPEVPDKVAAPPAAGSSATLPATPAAPPGAQLAKRLLVVDGADQGRFFPLPESGTVSIGNSNKHADIVLHDLYVSRVHCELQVDEGGVLVKHIMGQNGTLINGQRITEQPLQVGETLRVGNSHLRLELVLASEMAPKAEEKAMPVGVAGDKGKADEVVEDIELVDDEDVAEVDMAVAAVAGAGESYSLPHPPVDQLLLLEEQDLGHFRIGHLLGRGHSGLVFQAENQKNRHVVALKVLSPDFPAGEAELQRFVKALKSTIQLQHPNLVAAQGAGKTGSNCWIAREYIEGESLARLVQRLRSADKLDWGRACRVAVHLGKVLYFLHQLQITHGNITPRNILIRASDKRTKLADLMLNQALEGSQLQKAILGKKLLAELPYLAPEQTDPHAPVAPHTDLYALGTVLYLLLTGEPPFNADSPKEILKKIRAGKVVKPSKRQRDIPPEFEAAVLKLMAHDPKARFASAAEMLAVVEPLADEHEIAL